jgi:ribonucleoside-diphosphate reductase alpha chain
MSAVQPFLSGAISKTCNVPNEATVDDIREAYLEGWRLGLKALAIYRDGSKGSQPVSTKSESDTAASKAAKGASPESTPASPPPPLPPSEPAGTLTPILALQPGGPVTAPAPVAPTPSGVQPRRERLPHTRRSLTHKFDIQGHEGYVNVGFYPDGRPGELFITMAKEGSTIGGLMDVLGTAISIGLQYGVPLEVFVNKFAHSRFEPAGFTKNPDIPIAKSIADYIFRWLGMEFIPGYREANAPQRPVEESSAASTPIIKVNGHRTATIADLEHAEAVREVHHGNVAAQPVAALPDGPEGREQQFAHFQSDAPSCDSCGALTVRCGTCYRCFNCGNSMGCS